MRFLAPVGARRRSTRWRATVKQVFVVDRMRGLPRALAHDRPEDQPAVRSQAGAAVLAISCSTTSRTGDGIPQAAAQPNEIRTPALWGLRMRRPLLHDGRAATIDDAILGHGGEALAVRQAYERLSETMRRRLAAFLDSL